MSADLTDLYPPIKRAEAREQMKSAHSVADINHTLRRYLSRKEAFAFELNAIGPKSVKRLSPDRYVHAFKSLGGKPVLFELQHRRCGVCDRPFSDIQQAVVDHDHSTGLIRGLTHSRCNLRLGSAGDTSKAVSELAQYLERHQHVVRRKDTAKPRTLSYNKAERAHHLAIDRKISFWAACQLVWSQPDSQYPDETERELRAFDALGKVCEGKA